MHLFQRTLLGALPICVAMFLSLSSVRADDMPFTIAVIPDTQNYVDYKQQKAEGFPIDGSALFLEQIRYIADHSKSKGGDIVFALNVGDMWQHYSLDMDPEHKARGFKRVPSKALEYYEVPTPFTRTFEIPLIVRGYKLLDGVMPFAVVPGNHDYDALWTDAKHPPLEGVGGLRGGGMIHFTGLESFCSVFSAQSSFFKGKPWYVGSHDCGADSARIMEAGGYRFLHIGLQYDPPDSSLKWAQGMIEKYPGLPTILAMHHYLAPSGKRPVHVYDDPDRNSPAELWDKLVRSNAQIFLVLSGHRCGQSYSIDRNDAGGTVQQVLADYQCRGQVLKDAGMADIGIGLGDGWMRLMQFNLGGGKPRIHVRTYSTHYKAFSVDLPKYAAWYKAGEHPTYTDEEFHAEDDFVIELTDFHARFGPPRQ